MPPPTDNMVFRIYVHTCQGNRDHMEDRYTAEFCESKEKGRKFAFFGIFDGHGGAHAAQYAKKHLMRIILAQKNFWSNKDENILMAIRDGFLATHQAMWREHGKWPLSSSGYASTAGTTASIAFIRSGKLYMGHVGDSGIALGYKPKGSTAWCTQRLTKEHKPDNWTEKTRIIKAGGKVTTRSGVERVVWFRPRAHYLGPITRSTSFDEIPFLSVARSLGDFWSFIPASNEFAVSPEPDVDVIKIDYKTFKCLILGTDGIWNVVTPDEAVDITRATEEINRNDCLNNTTTPVDPSKMIVGQALQRWSIRNLRADNMTAVVVSFEPAIDGINAVRKDIVEVDHNNICYEFKLVSEPANADIGGCPKKFISTSPSKSTVATISSPSGGKSARHTGSTNDSNINAISRDINVKRQLIGGNIITNNMDQSRVIHDKPLHSAYSYINANTQTFVEAHDNQSMPRYGNILESSLSLCDNSTNSNSNDNSTINMNSSINLNKIDLNNTTTTVTNNTNSVQDYVHCMKNSTETYDHLDSRQDFPALTRNMILGTGASGDFHDNDVETVMIGGDGAVYSADVSGVCGFTEMGLTGINGVTGVNGVGVAAGGCLTLPNDTDDVYSLTKLEPYNETGRYSILFPRVLDRAVHNQFANISSTRPSDIIAVNSFEPEKVISTNTVVAVDLVNRSTYCNIDEDQNISDNISTTTATSASSLVNNINNKRLLIDNAIVIALENERSKITIAAPTSPKDVPKSYEDIQINEISSSNSTTIDTNVCTHTDTGIHAKTDMIKIRNCSILTENDTNYIQICRKLQTVNKNVAKIRAKILMRNGNSKKLTFKLPPRAIRR